MYIAEISDQKSWDEFVTRLSLNTFLHTSGWIDFNTKQGYKFWRLGLYNNGELVSIALILKIEAKRGRFLFCPHGPQSLKFSGASTDTEKVAELNIFVDYLRALAKKEDCSFVRFQPIVAKTPQNQEIFKAAGFRLAPIHMHTELSTVLDIKKSEDQMLLGMRKTTRQMVKKGMSLIQKNQVKVEFYDAISDDLYNVYESTGRRGGFVIYSKKYLQNEFDSFYPAGQASLYAVKYQGQILSWGMVIFAGKRAFYHQGANILNKDIPASYICQWTGITKAREYGCESYDFWGVAPLDTPSHPWKNISMFKRGFGGRDVELLHAQDLVLSWKYWLNWAVETIRAKRRGFA
jgi:peptidoglycan pentaglycine glycine transferase (the first glycine)